MPARKRSPADPLEPLLALLVQLNLTTLGRELAGILDRAQTGRHSYSQFLKDALEVELVARQARKVQRRVRWSKLGPKVTLEGFDWAARPQLSPQVVQELVTCRFIQEQRNAILVGRPSLGKTTVARAIGHAACERGHSVYNATMQDALEMLQASRADGTYRKTFRRLTACDLLILDNAGFATLDARATNELFRVVSARYRQRSTIVVTNLPFKRWGEFIASPAQAVAIADRLIHDATILRFTGKPFRNPRDISGAPLDEE
ncbi:MAG: IS21-like element helper ATPase IstB [Phycisphaerae bacterium]